MPPPPGLLGIFIGPEERQRRAEACAQERKAQWDAYNAQQRAETEQREEAEALAKQKQAEEQARLEREQANQKRQALQAQWAAYKNLRAAEDSPDNQCKTPDFARKLIEGWNSLKIDVPTITAYGLGIAEAEAIDIEHLTTTEFDSANSTFKCHGVFVTDRGRRLAGTVAIRPNVAGDPIMSWQADQSQDLSRYEPPSEPEPDTIAQAPATRKPEQPLSRIEETTNGSSASGLADRQRWETWLAGLSGDESDGAKWWAANRNVTHHKDCKGAGVAATDEAAWLAGCLNAQQLLTPIDEKRRSDPDYKKGWNSY